MSPCLLIEQVGNYMVIYARVPAWALLTGYLVIGGLILAHWWRKR